MLPPYGMITVFGAILVGITCGVVAGYAKSIGGRGASLIAGLLIAIILAVLVEAHGASAHFLYDFGDHIMGHLVAAVISYSISFTVVVGCTLLVRGAPHAVVSHAMGFLNLIPIPFGISVLGTVLLGIRWLLNKNEVERAWAAKQAFIVQLAFAVAIWIAVFTLPFLLLLLLPALIVITVMGVLGAKKDVSYSYPIITRWLGSAPMV